MAEAGFGFNELHAEERGLLLGLSLLAMDDAVLFHLAENRRQACGKAWQVLRALPRPDRAALLAGWIVEANAPFPSGMERLHPSWLAETVASEPVELWPALLCGLPGQAVEVLLVEFRWEPSEGSQTLPRWSAAGEGARESARGGQGGLSVPKAGGLPTRLRSR